jgi:uncharacterized phage-associated protein
MILKKIKVHNFKSIYGDFEMNFDDIKGFWKIEGSVGSGKTTIGEAIIYGLFGTVKGKNNRDLISWGEKNCKVSIECISKGHELVINRNIKGDLDVLVDGEPLVFTNKRDAQAQLEEEYYDISKMTLELLCIISFNNFKSLSNMTPADTRAFLDQVFGFSILTEYSDICKNKRKDVSSSIIETQYRKESVLKQIKKIESVVLYVLRNFPEGVDYIKLFKIMYFAQREYLAVNGLCIVEDTFKARPKGPVPALTYKVVKLAENGLEADCDGNDLTEFLASIEVGADQIIHAVKEPDMDYISKMEKKQIDETIAKYGAMDSKELSALSHDKAYDNAKKLMEDDPQKDILTTIDIARAGGASKPMVDHIREMQLIKAYFNAD